MQLSRHIRLVIALVIVAALLIIVGAILFITESALTVWAQLKESSPWVFYGYLGGIAVLAMGAAWVVWRLLVPSGGAAKQTTTLPPTQQDIDSRLAKAEESGVDVADAVRELQHLRERRATGEVYVAVFGDISAGKSSLIRSLVPGVDVRIAVTGGTTRNLTRYEWESPAGDRLLLVDMPGTNEPERGLDALARDEALRAHVVVYVCDGDLTRNQFQELQNLLALRKPLVLAVNKTDRYSEEDLKRILERVRERLAAWPEVAIVAIRAGGLRRAVRVLPDGTDEAIEQPVSPQIKPLQIALQNCIDNDASALEGLRDAAVFVLVGQKLDQAEAAHRRKRSDEIVRQYTRKAVVGALAAVSPGTDVVIQGYLSVNLIKELCSLYETPARELDMDRFLQLVQAQTGKTLPLVLALAGNALKAFPGIGTVVGGLAHAVAYGLIFDTLGRAVTRTLESRGALHPGLAAAFFKENLGEDLEARAKRLVELAASTKRHVRRGD